MTEYAAPYTGSPTTIVGGQSQPIALAIDAAGTLYVANYGNNTVTEYSAPYAAGSWTTISSGVTAPLALALSPPTSAGAAVLPYGGPQAARTHKASPSSVTSAPHPSRSSPRSSAVESGVET